jgi:hypothetical protein
MFPVANGGSCQLALVRIVNQERLVMSASSASRSASVRLSHRAMASFARSVAGSLKISDNSGDDMS